MRCHLSAGVALCLFAVSYPLVALAQDDAPVAEESVRVHLLAVLKETGELHKKAMISEHVKRVQPLLIGARNNPDVEKNLPERRFALRSDVKKYAFVRTWTQEYRRAYAMGDRHYQKLPAQEVWPRAEDAAELRKLITDDDPLVRGLAIEALATLHDPEDVPRIAGLLGDRAESIPVLGWNSLVNSPEFLPFDFLVPDKDVEDLSRCWQPHTVGTYARAALFLMTGKEFEAGKFDAWWAVQHGGRDRIWYWEQRLRRDLTLASEYRPPENGEQRDSEQYRLAESARFGEVRSAVANELAELPVEVELKVRLLALNHYSSALGCDNGAPMLGPFRCSRISSERLFELLERKNLWEEVDWEHTYYGYGTLVREIVGQAELFFEPKHVERLRAIYALAKKSEGGGGVEFPIGISRLLPPAEPDNRDDPDTQDGTLRALLTGNFKGHNDAFAQAHVACELVRVGLPRNEKFLVEFFFQPDVRGGSSMKSIVLGEFVQPPYTDARRTALAKLILDKRFDPVWLREHDESGDFLSRLYAISAVNAYAGSEVITFEERQNLDHQHKVAETFAKVKKTVRETLLPESPADEAE